MTQNIILNKYMHDLIKIYEKEDLKKPYVLNINFMDLCDSEINLGNMLLHNPEELLNELKEAVVKIQKEFQINGFIKDNILIRVYELPIVDGLHMHKFPDNKYVGGFLQISGLVIRVSSMKLLEFRRSFTCHKCKRIYTVEAIYECNNSIKLPKKCETEGCKSKTFEDVDRYNPKNCKNYQEIKIQESMDMSGCIPNTLIVTLEDDLVETTKPGDNVTVTGILKRRWLMSRNKSEPISSELVFKSNHIQVENDCNSLIHYDPDINTTFVDFWRINSNCPIRGRNLILKSIAPELYGMYKVKLAVALIMAGGCRNTSNDSSINLRSEPHLLLIGDPGMGKSQLLKFACKVIARSVFTNGLGTTSAGLTVTAIKENDEWQLKPGALVLSDNGICCIDEFNQMKEDDRVNLHEAMEQQTISVAKANIICKLNTRCSILASMNFKKGKFNNQKVTNLQTPLLSRFDLILPIKNILEEDMISNISDHVLDDDYSNDLAENLWTIEKLRSYFTIIRKLKPTMTEEASDILRDYYRKQRQTRECNQERRTVRMLESLIRLSEAHAKLMFRNTVETSDALAVIDLMDISFNIEKKKNYNDYYEFPEKYE